MLLSDVRFASRALWCPSRVPPCANRMLRGEGVCAQTALRVCSPLLYDTKILPYTISLIPTQISVVDRELHCVDGLLCAPEVPSHGSSREKIKFTAGY